MIICICGLNVNAGIIWFFYHENTGCGRVYVGRRRWKYISSAQYHLSSLKAAVVAASVFVRCWRCWDGFHTTHFSAFQGIFRTCLINNFNTNWSFNEHHLIHSQQHFLSFWLMMNKSVLSSDTVGELINNTAILEHNTASKSTCATFRNMVSTAQDF